MKLHHFIVSTIPSATVRNTGNILLGHFLISLNKAALSASSLISWGVSIAISPSQQSFSTSPGFISYKMQSWTMRSKFSSCCPRSILLTVLLATSMSRQPAFVLSPVAFGRLPNSFLCAGSQFLHPHSYLRSWPHTLQVVIPLTTIHGNRVEQHGNCTFDFASHK